MYLQATVSYIDAAKGEDDASTEDVDESRDTASGVSEEKVEASPDANASPMFDAGEDGVDHDSDDATADAYLITIDENSEGEIGDAIAATDTDGDVRLYDLGAETDNDNGDFTINDRTGQISVGAETPLDFENGLGTGPDGATNTYVVTVIATDPSGATDMATVLIVVEDVDEPPVLAGTNATELTIGEDGDDVDTTPDDPLAAAVDGEDLTYSATDNDQADSVVWSVSDEDNFEIGETSGALSFKTDADAPDYETQKEYKITITAVGNRTGGSDAKSTLDVTITVSNKDEAGTVSMTARQPQVGKSVKASVEDPDGDASGVTWQWASQAAEDDDGTCALADDGDWEDIEMATSASYTPASDSDRDDDGDCLRATATYTDPAKPEDVADTPEDESRGDAMGVTERAVETKPAANSKPKFPDDEMPDGADPIEMDVEEGTEGLILTVTANDSSDGDLLIYELGGDDGGSFSIVAMGDGEGEISVGDGTTLDFEGQKVYSFTAKATDPSGAAAEVSITINVTDKDEKPELNNPPAFAAEMAARSVDENSAAGTDVGDPITATDENTGDSLTYSLDAMGDMYFDIDDMGQITVGDGAMLDHETTASHTVTVTAMDTGRLYAMIMVTITVTDVNEAPSFDALQADRDVDENTEAGMAIGDPVAAMDVDADDTLTYSLDAAGEMYFDIDAATGQLMTEAALDYEMTTSYDVTVMATDAAGLYAMIAVTIAVNDVGETPLFDAETATFMVYENMDVGSAVGTVTAEQAESYSDDSGYFDVDDMGQITTAMMLDYESMTSHMVTVTATGVDGTTDSIAVTVNVGNVEECEDAGATAVADTDTASAGAMADCEALLASRDALMGEDATRMLNWSADTPIAEWYGVRKLSESGRVEWLYLHGVSAKDATDDTDARAEVKLNGTIPAELGGLTEMTRLYLHRNNLAGEIPAELNGLTNLVWLRLYDNMLSGDVPDLSGMTSLERFYIHENDLTGGVPTALSNSVTHILVHRNMLTGEIPDLSGMTNLVWLGLYDNGLSGVIPATVGSIANLKRLYLHGNALTGAVPMEIGNLASLTNLWLTNNMLSGELPSSLDNLTDLVRVRISGNSFTAAYRQRWTRTTTTSLTRA